MNKIFKYFSILTIVAVLFSACSPEEFALGKKDVAPSDLVEGIAFKIEHDATNPNIVYLKSLMGPEYTPLWNHPQGRSQEQTVTLKIPFAGTYDVEFGVMTRGGVVYGDTVTFTVDNLYAGFISDPLWSKLSGGAGNEKTWYLDLDENAVSRFFAGPLYFYGTNDSWESVTNGIAVGGDSWNWNPDYKGNSWLMTAADFGSMTFDLKNGANVTIEHKTIPSRGTENAKYLIDVENHTMKISGGGILHDSNRDGAVIDWGSLKIMSLTDSTMQLAALRDPVLSGEGACLLVYNFISKDYKDNWTPGVVAEPEPTLPDGWQTDVSQTTSKTIKWVLSTETPFNWANLDGSLMNTDWTAADKYASWTGFNAAAAATYANFSLTLNSDAMSAVYVAPDGTSTTGTYTLDDKGVYTFDGFKPNFVICGGWVTLSTTDANQWRITKVEKDLSGNVTGMWVGKRDPSKAEYMVYHLIPQVGSSTSEPKGTEISVDNSKLVIGDPESKGVLRLEIYNEYGSSKTNPSITAADIKFASKMSIKFTLSDITLKSGAAGSYTAGIAFANPDWTVQYWGGGSGDTTVTGNGTYEVSFEPTATVSNGALVFVIDIKGLYNDLEDPSKVKATIDKLVLY